jgi:hypothetical protein
MMGRAIVGAVLGLALAVEVTPQPTGEGIAKDVLVDASAGVGTHIPHWKRRYP